MMFHIYPMPYFYPRLINPGYSYPRWAMCKSDKIRSAVHLTSSPSVIGLLSFFGDFIALQIRFSSLGDFQISFFFSLLLQDPVCSSCFALLLPEVLLVLLVFLCCWCVRGSELCARPFGVVYSPLPAVLTE
ncbi:hypothetical protein Dimus_038634 [Dionaea muscipula]